MKYKLLRKICTVTSMFLAGLLAVGTIIAGESVTSINNYLGAQSFKLVETGNPISYLDPVWETFMDQLIWDETVLIVSSGFHLTQGAESVAKPATKDENGPNGFGGWAGFSGLAVPASTTR